MEYLQNEMVELKNLSRDCGEYLLAVENLISKHTFLETQVNEMDQRLKKINRQAIVFTRITTGEGKLVKDKLDALNKEFLLIESLALERRKFLEQKRDLHKFIEECETEDLWLQEELDIIKSPELGNDLNSTSNLLKKLEQLENEKKNRKQQIDKIVQSGDTLTGSKLLSATENKLIAQKCTFLKNKLLLLSEIAQNRRLLLEDAYSSHQYYTDSNEAQSWIADKMKLVNLGDYGGDEASSQALLQRHNRIESEINAYETDIQRLDGISKVLMGQRRLSSFSDDAIIEKDTFESRLVPEEIEVEEIIEKEIREVYPEEANVLCVRVMYPYDDGKHFTVQKNEILELKNKTNNEWWLIVSNKGQVGYVPANYVKEIGLQRITRLNERLVKKKIPIKIKKTIMKPVIEKSDLRTTQESKQMATQIQLRQLLSIDDIKSKYNDIKSRQIEINNSFDKLKCSAGNSRKCLESTIAFYKWQSECDKCVKWLKEKQIELSLDKGNSLIENQDAVERHYQAFKTDFLMNQSRVQLSEKLAGDALELSQIGQSNVIKKKQADLIKEWNKLLELKKYWDNNAFKANTYIESFNLLYADVKELINEKLNSALCQDDINQADVRSVKALQTKKDKLQREIGPIDTQVNELKKQADEVVRYFPQKKEIFNQNLQEIDALWCKFKDSVTLRKAKLDERHDQQRFENEAHGISQLYSNILYALKELENPRDFKQCEEMIKKFNELKDDFNNRLYKFDELKNLSKQLLTKRSVSDVINEALDELIKVKLSTAAKIEEKTKYLDDYQKYLKLKQDANKLELKTQDQEAFLQYEDLGDSSENVDDLLKRQDEFMAKVNVLDERVKNFIEILNKLIQQKRFASVEIEFIAKKLSARHKKLVEKANDCRYKLTQAKDFFEFKNDCDEIDSWINEKKCFIENLNVPPPGTSSAAARNTIDKLLVKHADLEKILHANLTRLKDIKRNGNDLIVKKNYAQNEIKALIQSLEQKWKDLETQASIKGKLLNEQCEISKMLSNFDTYTANLEKYLAGKDTKANDLRSAKEALKKHQDLEHQIVIEADLVKQLSKNTQIKPAPASKSDALDNAVCNYLLNFQRLKPALEEKRLELENNVFLQQCLLDLDEELKWIANKKLILQTPVSPKDLLEAQSYFKKFNEIEPSLDNHKPVNEKLYETGHQLTNDPLAKKNQVYPDILAKLKQLKQEWENLLSLAGVRKNKIGVCLKEQQLIDNLNKIGSWISEKRVIVDNVPELNADDATISAKIAKLATLQHDLRGYKEMMSNLNAQRPNDNNTATEFAHIENELSNMEAQISDRKRALELALNTNEFNREAHEFFEIIDEKRIQAQSEDYGQDYEHLQLIKEKFSALCQVVQSLEPRYTRIKGLGTDLINRKALDSKQIRKTMDDLKNNWNLLQEDIKQRDNALDSAKEIHSFNEDVQELLRHINEKELSLSTGLGKDLQSCKDLIRKHEIFTEELGALQPKLLKLSNQSNILCKKHPGETADHITAQMEDLVDEYRDLCTKVDKRHKDLENACKFFEFMICIKDVRNWMNETRRAIQLQPTNINDLFTIKQFKEEHEQLQSEMSQRDDLFKEIDEAAIGASKKNHPRSKEIQSHTEKVLQEREDLFREWGNKSLALELLYECNILCRDANQLLNRLDSKEIYLKNTCENDHNSKIPTVDTVETSIKTHDIYYKKVTLEDNKVNSIIEDAARIIVKDLPKELSSKVETLINLIWKKRCVVYDLCDKYNVKLNNLLKLAKWKLDTDVFVQWIEDRLSYSRSFIITNKLKINPEILSSNEKDKLVLHQKALNIEVHANKSRYYALLKMNNVVGTMLYDLETKELKKKLEEKWHELENEIRNSLSYNII